MAIAVIEEFEKRLEDTNSTASEDFSKADRPSIALLIPSSCREGFTNDVCGLPSHQAGCWRYRETLENRTVVEKGIRPSSLAELTEPLIAWLVFESPIDGTGIKIPEVHNSKPEFSGSHHQALFGFTKTGLNAFRDQTELGWYPNYVEYNGVFNGSKYNVKNWLLDKKDRSDRLGLADCFGQDTFKPQEIKNKELGLDLRLSLSDIIRSYLNHNQNCKFRQVESERAIGITICKVGVELSKTPVILGRAQEAQSKAPQDLLTTSTVSFSYLETETLTIRKLPEWCIGKHGCDHGSEGDLKSLSDSFFVPLRVRRFSDKPDDGIVNFATSLSKYGRQNVLPAEVGKSFLSFSVGELTSYLLHWLLLRIFANGSENDAFIEVFADWRRLLDDGNTTHAQRFSELLDKPVLPAVDMNVFTGEIMDLQLREKHFGVYSSPVLFSELLSFLGLNNGPYGAWISPTLAFLKSFFSPRNSNQSFRQLPMYKHLEWRESTLLRQVDRSSSKESQVEAAIDCIARASGLTTDDNRQSVALEELRRHSERSVFPIADVLANLPHDSEMPHYYYYIFPLWEETIRDDIGQEWRGPVIFAHVFTRSLSSEPNSPLPSDREIIATGEKLQSSLLPAGAAIAHDFYKKMLAQKSAWTHARAWAHEVKNYTSPIIDDLDSPVLRKYSADTFEEAHHIVEGARRGVLILNAVSKAVQLSLNSRVSSRDVKAIDRDSLIRLSRDDGQELVELALQYLLNYRHQFLESSTLQKYTIDWTPRQTTNQTLERLSEILNVRDEKDVVTNERVIGVLALLREAVWNIRNEAPVKVNDRLPVIKLSYELSAKHDVLSLILRQEQSETNEGAKNTEPAPGIRLANVLFGAQGAEFGRIAELAREPPVKKARRHFLTTRKIKVDFDLA